MHVIDYIIMWNASAWIDMTEWLDGLKAMKEKTRRQSYNTQREMKNQKEY